MDALAEEAQSYLKDKHYEANVAVNMLAGKDNAEDILHDSFIKKLIR